MVSIRSNSEVESEMEAIDTFRDTFYEHYPDESEENRERLVRQRVLALLECMPRVSDSPDVDRSIWLQRARVWNLCVGYERECEELLSKYLKLDADNVEVWVEMGKCLVKKPDLEYALECLECGYEVGRSSMLLSQIASILRFQLGSTKDERKCNELRIRSLLLSEEATKLEPDVGAGWLSLGNARLAHIFSTSYNQDTLLKSAIEAYRNALKDKRVATNPDLHLNLAAALRYDEQFEACLEHSRLALRYDPHSVAARDRLKSLNKYLGDVSEAVVKKGRLKPKRLGELLATLDETVDVPRESRKLASPFGESPSSAMSVCTVSSLDDGPNPTRIVYGKVVAAVPSDQAVPCTFVLCDRSEECVVVTVYNFSQHFTLLIGDSLAIRQPHVYRVENVCTTSADGLKGEIVSYTGLRVSSPIQLIRNGKVMKGNQIALASVKFTGDTS